MILFTSIILALLMAYADLHQKYALGLLSIRPHSLAYFTSKDTQIRTRPRSIRPRDPRTINIEKHVDIIKQV